MDVQAVHFNGGFARAAALTPAEILTDLAGAEALIAAEPALIDEVNARGAESASARLAEGGQGDLAGDRRRSTRRGSISRRGAGTARVSFRGAGARRAGVAGGAAAERLQGEERPLLPRSAGLSGKTQA